MKLIVLQFLILTLLTLFSSCVSFSPNPTSQGEKVIPTHNSALLDFYSKNCYSKHSVNSTLSGKGRYIEDIYFDHSFKGPYPSLLDDLRTKSNAYGANIVVITEAKRIKPESRTTLFDSNTKEFIPQLAQSLFIEPVVNPDDLEIKGLTFLCNEELLQGQMSRIAIADSNQYSKQIAHFNYDNIRFDNDNEELSAKGGEVRISVHKENMGYYASKCISKKTFSGKIRYQKGRIENLHSIDTYQYNLPDYLNVYRNLAGSVGGNIVAITEIMKMDDRHSVGLKGQVFECKQY